MTLTEFAKLGAYIVVDDKKIFVIDINDPSDQDKETLVIVNGFPSTAYDFMPVINHLRPYFRIVIHDHPGFGLSEDVELYEYSLINIADNCVKLWQKLGISTLSIVGHNYGFRVVQEILYRFNSNILPFKIQRAIMSRDSSKWDFIKLINSDPSTMTAVRSLNDRIDHSDHTMNQPLSDEEKKENESLNIKTKNAFIVSNFIEEEYLYWHRWILALQKVECKTYIMWRRDDLGLKELFFMLSQRLSPNVKFEENDKCFVIEENATEWSSLLLKLMNLGYYRAFKNEHLI